MTDEGYLCVAHGMKLVQSSIMALCSPHGTFHVWALFGGTVFT